MNKKDRLRLRHSRNNLWGAIKDRQEDLARIVVKGQENTLADQELVKAVLVYVIGQIAEDQKEAKDLEN